VELARASLQGVDLPSEVESFVRNVQATPQEPPAASTPGATAAPPAPDQQPGASLRYFS